MTKTEEALKPCEYCKESNAFVEEWGDPPADEHAQVVCRGCGARSPDCDSPGLAIKAWNTRTTEAQYIYATEEAHKIAIAALKARKEKE